MTILFCSSGEKSECPLRWPCEYDMYQRGDLTADVNRSCHMFTISTIANWLETRDNSIWKTLAYLREWTRQVTQQILSTLIRWLIHRYIANFLKQVILLIQNYWSWNMFCTGDNTSVPLIRCLIISHVNKSNSSSQSQIKDY